MRLHFWSLIIINAFISSPLATWIEAIVHPADVRAALLLAAIGMSQIFMHSDASPILSKYRWIFILSVHLALQLRSDGLINERPPEGVILAVYSVPQLPMLFAKIRRLRGWPGLDSETGYIYDFESTVMMITAIFAIEECRTRRYYNPATEGSSPEIQKTKNHRSEDVA